MTESKKDKKIDKVSMFRDKMHSLERKHRGEWVELKNSLQTKRESLCESWGGHYYGEDITQTVKMALGWKTYIYRICEVCRKEKHDV
ncbi:hypothetical protein N8Z24_00560 [bacterium]|nr:hypothetical protein [bacterium]